jgi:hypothetical protein
LSSKLSSSLLWDRIFRRDTILSQLSHEAPELPTQPITIRVKTSANQKFGCVFVI